VHFVSFKTQTHNVVTEQRRRLSLHRFERSGVNDLIDQSLRSVTYRLLVVSFFFSSVNNVAEFVNYKTEHPRNEHAFL